jgi:HEAT repeat protein
MNRRLITVMAVAAALFVAVVFVRWRGPDERPPSTAKRVLPQRKADAPRSRAAALQAYLEERGRRGDAGPRQVMRNLPPPVIPPAAPPSRPLFDAELVGTEVNTESFASVISALARHPDPEQRVAAVEALPEFEGQPIIPVLGRVLRDPAPEVRVAAVEAIAEIENIELLPPVKILELALEDPEPDVRMAVLDFASELDDHWTWPLIEKGLEDPDEEVRATAQALADAEVRPRPQPPRSFFPRVPLKHWARNRR